MIRNYWTQFALIFIVLPVLSGCITTQYEKTASTREVIMQGFLTDIERSDGIDAREAVLLARSELIFRGFDQEYSLKQPLVDYYDEDNYIIQFFSSNKTLGQVITGASVAVIVHKDTGHVYVEENYKNPGRYHAAS